MKKFGSDGYVERVLAQIEPQDSRTRACNRAILYAIEGVKNTMHLRTANQPSHWVIPQGARCDARLAPSPATERKQFAQLGKLAAQMEAAINSMRDIVGDHLFERGELGEPVGRKRFLNDLQRIQGISRKFAPPDKRFGLQFPPGSKAMDPVAYRAAKCAQKLILEYSNQRPTLSKKGPYYAVASILVAAATGKKNVRISNVERACQRVADER